MTNLRKAGKMQFLALYNFKKKLPFLFNSLKEKVMKE